jgi:O-antigen ligase
VKELGNLIFGFAFVFSFQQACKQLKAPLEFLLQIFYWPLGFILAFSFFEIATKSHLPSAYATEILNTDPTHFVRLSPSATFGNPNHLGIFLVLSFFILYSQIIHRIHLQKALIFLIPVLIVLWFTLSRFGLMAVLLPVLYLPFHFKNEIKHSLKNQKRNWLGVGFLILGTGLIVLFHRGFTGGIFAARGDGSETPVVDPLAKSSLAVRTNMLKNGWEITKQSNFLGVGPGQFSELMKYQPQKFETFGYTDPHSGAVEIISQYGILCFLLWIFWSVGVLFICIKGLKTDPAYWLTPLFMTIAFIPVSAANSSFLASPLTWAYVGILHILVTPKLRFSPSREGKPIR